ncbi:MAG: flagellar protein [Clostridiales bacterium]|jgi:flagellar operon protein|nr:flagellar protein [Clostridiales bacterium]
MINKVVQPSRINANVNNINARLNANIDFSKVLEDVQAKKDLKISAHAMDRLRERNITLTDSDISNLKSAVENIRSKGGREALILYNNVAYITSIKNNTIITAVDSNSLKENVFTNIDSAVIV